MSSTPSPQFTGNTAVTVVLTSTANDQLLGYNIGFSGITLTEQSGKTATLLPASANNSGPWAEFVHINSKAEPLLTAAIPQGVYTSATISISEAGFDCSAYGLVDGTQTISSAFYMAGVIPAVTVNFPSPITVTGASTVLSLDLEVLQSETIGSCLSVDDFAGFSIAPKFSLVPLSIIPVPTNATNGKVIDLDGEITALTSGGQSFTLGIPTVQAPRSLSVAANGSTAFQGISDFSALAVGTFVNVDGAIQANGSLLASRIAVEDPSAAEVFRGPLLQVDNAASEAFVDAREQQGNQLPGYSWGFGNISYSGATFQISDQLPNLKTLPFTPAFDPTSIVPGQEVYVSAPGMAPNGYANTAVLTLMPQTINGTITASSQSGNFTVYTTSLAPYDLFPAFAVQPNQPNVEIDPSQVQVYVDDNTQLLNTQTLAAGGTFRFYGLVFDDNGTLRMDCAQVNDGVAFSAPPSASQQSYMPGGVVQQIRRATPGGSQQIISTIKTRPQS